MVTLVIRRIAVALVLVFGLATLVFFLSRLLPGDPALLFIAPSVPASVADRLRNDFGLSGSFTHQYISWIAGILHGQIGYSFSLHREVLGIIGNTLPYTLLLAGSAIALEFVLAIGVVYCLSLKNSPSRNRFFSVASISMYTIPSFWIAYLLLQTFTVSSHIFPSSHYHSVGIDTASWLSRNADFLLHLILPVCTLALPGAAGLSRFLKASVDQVAGMEYVLFARSQGQSTTRIFFRTILPNAIAPLLTLGGLELGTLLAGALITEQIFSLPGMGRLTIAALFARDYPLILGCTMTAGIAVIASNMLADILHATLDPRIRGVRRA
jgi:peptide/nickel transport system permease protein